MTPAVQSPEVAYKGLFDVQIIQKCKTSSILKVQPKQKLFWNQQTIRVNKGGLEKCKMIFFIYKIGFFQDTRIKGLRKIVTKVNSHSCRPPFFKPFVVLVSKHLKKKCFYLQNWVGAALLKVLFQVQHVWCSYIDLIMMHKTVQGFKNDLKPFCWYTCAIMTTYKHIFII